MVAYNGRSACGGSGAAALDLGTILRFAPRLLAYGGLDNPRDVPLDYRNLLVDMEFDPRRSYRGDHRYRRAPLGCRALLPLCKQTRSAIVVFGDPLTVSGELEISDVYIDADAANLTYLFTDIYNQSYWTAPVK